MAETAGVTMHEPAPPDVLLPGERSVNHELVIAGPIDPSVQLLAFPTRGFDVAHVIEPGQPFAFSSKYGTRVYAIPRDVTVPSDVSAEWLSTFPASATFPQVVSVPANNPLAHVLSTYRVTSIADRTVQLQLTDERREDAQHHAIESSMLVPLLFGIMAVGAIGLAWVVRRRPSA